MRNARKMKCHKNVSIFLFFFFSQFPLIAYNVLYFLILLKCNIYFPSLFGVHNHTHAQSRATLRKKIHLWQYSTGCDDIFSSWDAGSTNSPNRSVQKQLGMSSSSKKVANTITPFPSLCPPLPSLHHSFLSYYLIKNFIIKNADH